MPRTNQYGQPIGPDLGSWVSPPLPGPGLKGRTVELEQLLSSLHAEALYAAFTDAPDSLWSYMSFGPFCDIAALSTVIDSMVAYPDWLPYAIVVDGEPMGFASYLRIDPPDGVIEIGSIVFAPMLQRTTAATEALYLLIKHAFDLGYRRCEWKCDDLNAPSRAAAERLGFHYEGTFCRATHYKGRNRDTSWYAITDTDWPPLESAFRTWLSPDNFGPDDRQRTPLREFMIRT